MALFNITRYTGNKDNDNELKDKEETLLSKINKRALKRKSVQSMKIHEDEDVIKKKKVHQISLENNSDNCTSNNKTNVKDNNKIKPKRQTKKIVQQVACLESGVTEVVQHSHQLKCEEDESGNFKHEKSEIGSKQIQVDLFEDDIRKANSFEDNHENEPNDESKEAFTVLGNVTKRKLRKVKRVLPQWLSQPSVVKADIRHNTTPLSDLPGIDELLLKKLQENGIASYFPVQAQVIPFVLEGVNCGFLTGPAGYRPNDICCSAPTGSGKTLAYVLPIVQALRKRVTCEVRALIVLPVRDLAVQVYKVFQTFCDGTPLKVGSLIGTKSFSQEQNYLVKKGPRGYYSCLDIIVATPGRLVDHINSTAGFLLKHLRFLVIDEADCMMEEMKQDWLSQVDKFVFSQDRLKPGPLTASCVSSNSIPLQKLLFSATLSQNPEKLQQLGLFQPRLFTSIVKDSKTSETRNDAPKDVYEPTNQEGDFIGKYTTPSGLTERFIPSTSSEKPLVMLYCLYHLKFKHVLCFTNSVEATHRLCWLIKLVGGLNVEEFSSKLHKNKRSKLIKKFQSGKIDVLICSDAMARGMDVENVQYVISYESPPYLKTYIHRVGRTARAGKVGTALTLLEKKEVFHFKKMMTEAGKTVKEMKVKKSDIKPYVDSLQGALEQLPDVLKAEKISQKK